MEPPARTDWVGMSSSCQFRSKPCRSAGSCPPGRSAPAAFCRWRADRAAARGSPSASWKGARPARSCGPAARRWHRPARSRRAARARSPDRPRRRRQKLMNGSTTMEFCLAVAVVPDSRNRSASMESMPVARFSSSGVSSSSRPCAGSCAMESPGMPTESSCSAFIMVRSASRTSAAEAKRAEGCFSRQRRISDSSSTGRSGTISRRLGGSANWVARMVWNSGASARWKGWLPLTSS